MNLLYATKYVVGQHTKECVAQLRAVVMRRECQRKFGEMNSRARVCERLECGGPPFDHKRIVGCEA